MNYTSQNSYVLITPVRNGAKTIEATVKSVLAQSVQPSKWIIVNDGSTDQTAKILTSMTRSVPYIKVLHLEKRVSGNFKSKVAAFNHGFQHLADEPFDLIGNLDADVILPANYYQEILQEFARDASLGLAGGLIIEVQNGVKRLQKNSANSIAGAVQLFRRKCFEDIQGYEPLVRGGIDTLAEIKVRMKKWKVKLLPHLQVQHLGPVLTGQKNFVRTRFSQGITRYLLGYHPVFHCASSISRITDRPFAVGGAALIMGYFWAAASIRQRAVPVDVVRYLQEEQLGRIKSMMRTLLSARKSNESSC